MKDILRIAIGTEDVYRKTNWMFSEVGRGDPRQRGDQGPRDDLVTWVIVATLLMVAPPRGSRGATNQDEVRGRSGLMGSEEMSVCGT